MYVRYLHVDSPPLHGRGSVDDLPGSDVTHAMTGLLGSHWRIQIGTHTNNLLTSVMGWVFWRCGLFAAARCHSLQLSCGLIDYENLKGSAQVHLVRTVLTIYLSSLASQPYISRTRRKTGEGEGKNTSSGTTHTVKRCTGCAVDCHSLY